MTDKKISNAPAPITPVRGGGATGLSRKSLHETEVNQVHTSSPPDWSCWLAGRSVTLDQAVALTLNLDPDSLQKTGWLITSKSFADQVTGELFSKRLGAIQGYFKKTNIRLSLIADWAVVEAKWKALPPELLAMVEREVLQKNCTPVAVQPTPVELVAPIPAWRLKSKPVRMPGYRWYLYQFLQASHAAGKPCPKAKTVLDAWKLYPMPTLNVITKGRSVVLEYELENGSKKTADLKAVQAAIDVLMSKE